MAIFFKKEVITDRQKQINELKEEIHNCEILMHRTETLFHMAVDDSLIEARIYQMKSLAKQHDYLIKKLRRLMYTDSEQSITVNI